MRFILISLIIFLELIQISNADDINEFEIGSFSVGKSLLDYKGKDELLNFLSNEQYPNQKYIIYNADLINSDENYDYMTVTTKRGDDQYIITSVSGIINYEELDQCLKMKNEIRKFIEQIIKYDDFDETKYASTQDKTGKSIIYGVQYYLKPYPSTESINVNCYHFSKETTNKKRNLKVSVNTHEYSQFLINEAFK
tara:strand:- start:1049 stop:1636 length:588 start_codon:yes stop_codon:yes gene_type:complete